MKTMKKDIKPKIEIKEVELSPELKKEIKTD